MISLITSLYRSEKYLVNYLKRIDKFYSEVDKHGLQLEISIILNDPTNFELESINIFSSTRKWIKKEIVEREPLYATWNRGIRGAKYDIIGFWNVDDSRFSGALIKSVDLFKNGAQLVYFPFKYKRYIKFFNSALLVKTKIIYPPESFNDNKFRFISEMHCGPFFMFTRDLYDKTGSFDEQFKISGDFDWCARAARNGNFSYCNEVAGEFSNMGDSLSGSKSLRQVVENNVVYKRQGYKDKIISVSEEIPDFKVYKIKSGKNYTDIFNK
jgi:GT2 family glycosyltransferase